MVKYLSPTSLQAWRKDKTEFYLRYVATDRPDKFPQTPHMAVGSAFDAYVKSELGKVVGVDIGFDELFEKQVEPQNRDKARVDGRTVYERYQGLGCIGDLVTMVAGAARFEFTVMTEEKEINSAGLKLLGKPDASFTDRFGNDIILDWKVNGFYAKSQVSPVKGYVRVRPGGQSHRGAVVMENRGVMCNVAMRVEDCNEIWALQLATYAWLTGHQIGSDFIVAIDQIVGPEIRVAEYRGQVGGDYQWKLYEEYCELWRVIESGWIFRDLSEEASRDRQQVLNNQAQALREGGEWFAKATRGC